MTKPHVDPAESTSGARQDRAIHVRDAEPADVDRLAKIWYDAWRDAHEQLMPAELTRLRTLELFRDRLQKAGPSVRVVDIGGEPLGLCILRGDELYQLFLAARARGTGAAAMLIADAEARLADVGFNVAWLACAIGNERAARFYEKCGWRRVGNMISQAETPDRVFDLEVWRYEKRLRR